MASVLYDHIGWDDPPDVADVSFTVVILPIVSKRRTRWEWREIGVRADNSYDAIMAAARKIWPTFSTFVEGYPYERVIGEPDSLNLIDDVKYTVNVFDSVDREVKLHREGSMS
jgi:hypothetical protein